MKFIRDIFGSPKAHKTPKDEHNQPMNRTFNAARLNNRKVDELIGLCKGLAADNVVNQSEAEFLREWMLANREIAGHWPANVLFARIMEMLEDRILDATEQQELLDTLQQITGGDTQESKASNVPTSLPLCSPAPVIAFENTIFCFTGKFATGSRKQVEQMVITRGARTKSAPTQDTNYLVIGSVGSTDWIHSTHGRKIEKAVELKSTGHQIAIVSEKHWFTHFD